jgi:hypothetical protein
MESDVKCPNCKYATNKDVMRDPDLLDPEVNMPRCTNEGSEQRGLIIYAWMSCDEFEEV